jgi:hypothetical protein
MKILFSILLAALVSLSNASGVIWLEAERFSQAGGWSTDTQFVDTMGSVQLLATGCGKPVDDAVTQAAVPASGAYRLWVRCRDWLPEHSPGMFQVAVNGKASATTFGKAKDDKWKWIDGGVFELQAGTVEVRLHDLTGWWGRCEAVVLAQGDFKPSNDLAELARQRLQYGGLSSEPELMVCSISLSWAAVLLGWARPSRRRGSDSRSR